MTRRDQITLDDLLAPDGPATITVTQAATILRISRGAAYSAVAAEQLPTIRIGRRLLVAVPALLSMLGATPRAAAREPSAPVQGGAATRAGATGREFSTGQGRPA